jgi:hypothetical protein
MPLWNNKTLHLVIDTDNGTVFDDNANPLTSGTTYKVTLSGSAKDSDGKTIGSDVVKYITPKPPRILHSQTNLRVKFLNFVNFTSKSERKVLKNVVIGLLLRVILKFLVQIQ